MLDTKANTLQHHNLVYFVEPGSARRNRAGAAKSMGQEQGRRGGEGLYVQRWRRIQARREANAQSGAKGAHDRAPARRAQEERQGRRTSPSAQAALPARRGGGRRPGRQHRRRAQPK